jgi:uncharacterized membrane protein
MRVSDFGRILFAVSFAVLGGLLAGVQGFADVWPTVPKWAPAREALAMLSGVVLLIGGVGLLVPRIARVGALVLAGFLVLELLVLKLPHVVAHPLLMGVYEDGGESLACLGGAWVIFAMLPHAGGRFENVRIGQILFGLALVPFGLAHFVYLDQTAPLIPSWLPFPVTLSYLTGAAHIAAGLGILFGVLPWLAATLEAVMVSLFTLLVWVPAIVRAPSPLPNWSELCVSAAISGAAWVIAGSLTTRARVARDRGSSAGPA